MMQIHTSVAITDEEGIQKFMETARKIDQELRSGQYGGYTPDISSSYFARCLAEEYNGGEYTYEESVAHIYEVLFSYIKGCMKYRQAFRLQ